MSHPKYEIAARFISLQKLFVLLALLIPLLASTQSHNLWTRSFNEESSLLSGAVVGGGAGPSAIYYNPASITEIKESKFSLHVSLFSYNFLNIKNAGGDSVDLSYSKIVIEPRFLSYMIKPKNHPEWSFEFAYLNNENYHLDVSQSVDTNLNILTNSPGLDRYYAYFQFRNAYRNDWIGGGGSWKINPRLSVGLSMFITVESLEYSYTMDINAYPLDSVFIDDVYIPFYAANYQEMEYVKYNDYRLLWKIGLFYAKNRVSVGLNITTPSIGGIYSDGKRVMRKQSQSNITNPDTGEPIPNYVLADYQEKKNVFVNSKSQFSVAAGLTYYSADSSKTLYTTVEYFAGLEPFSLVQANENPYIGAGTADKSINFSEWLTYLSGAKPVFNAAIGYRWTLKKDLMLLAGFRTDFNYRKNMDSEPYFNTKEIKGVDLDEYHLTGGLSWTIKGQNIMTGLQYTTGREKNQQQFVNLTSPVEFNVEEHAPLVGTKQNNMNAFYNSISLYFGATFNFGAKKPDGK